MIGLLIQETFYAACNCPAEFRAVVQMGSVLSVFFNDVKQTCDRSLSRKNGLNNCTAGKKHAVIDRFASVVFM